MQKTYYVDGKFVNAENAAIPITDLAIVRGYGVFDFFRTYEGLPIQLERNVQRLRNSARVIEMELPWSNEEIADIVMQTVERNSFDESNVRIIVTGGDSPNFIMPDEQPRLLVYVEPLQPLPDWWYTQGVKVITVEEERYLPRSKSLNYIPAIVALKQAHRANAVEALYMDHQNHVREGTTTNVFAFFGDKVITPAMGILPGITRGRVIEILERDYAVVERSLDYDELLAADEVVITAANKQVVPVVQVDAHVYGERPGQRSFKLMQDFADYVAGQVHHRPQVSG